MVRHVDADGLKNVLGSSNRKMQKDGIIIHVSKKHKNTPLDRNLDKSQLLPIQKLETMAGLKNMIGSKG